MPSTYEPIATTTLGSAAASITFSSIPATYTDLRLVLSGTVTVGGYGFYARFNSDSGTNYSRSNLFGDGSSAGTNAAVTNTSTPYQSQSGMSSTVPTLYEFDIFSYAGSTYKTMLSKASEDKNGSGTVALFVTLWRSTSAINSVSFINGNTFAAGTTATLYGIKNA